MMTLEVQPKTVLLLGLLLLVAAAVGAEDAAGEGVYEPDLVHAVTPPSHPMLDLGYWIRPSRPRESVWEGDPTSNKKYKNR
jgi:hypothetical protein